MTVTPSPNESNGLTNGGVYHTAHYENHAGRVSWNDARLAKITRLRLLTDPGFPAWDVSYCHGRIGSKKVRVRLPFHQIPKYYAPEAKIPGLGHYKQFIINMGNKENPPLFVKKTGILDSFAMLQM